MTILTIEEMEILNFRKLHKLNIKFSDKTRVEGHNEAGKSTILAAHKVLWTGKDREGVEDYDNKPRDEFGKTVKGIAPSIQQIIRVNKLDENIEYRIKLKRVTKEVYKLNDDGEEYLSGHTTEYWIDDVKQPTETKWKQELAKLISPDAFFVLGDPAYVLSKKATELRNILLSMAGEITDKEILDIRPDFKKLVDALKTKDYDSTKKQILSQIKTLEEQKVSIPVSITEALETRPKVEDWDQIEKEIKEKTVELENVNRSIDSLSKGEAFDNFEAKKTELENWKLKKQQAENAVESSRLAAQKLVNNRKAPLQQEIQNADSQLRNLEFALKNDEKELPVQEAELSALQDEYDKRDAEIFTFNDEEGICDACGSVLKDLATKKADLEKKFNDKKIVDLERLIEKGTAKSTQVEGTKTRIAENTAKIADIKSQKSANETALAAIKDAEVDVEKDPAYIEAVAKIEELELDTVDKPVVDDKELVAVKEKITEEIAQLNQKLGLRKVIADSIARVEMHEETLKNVNVALMKWLNSKANLKEYSEVRSSLLEEKVNRKFKLVRFELFRKKFDGSGDFEEICRPTYKGVPYLTVNTAGKAAMFIDVVNTFSEHYGVCITTFVDNWESIYELPETRSPLVYLQYVENSPLTIINE